MNDSSIVSPEKKSSLEMLTRILSCIQLLIVFVVTAAVGTYFISGRKATQESSRNRSNPVYWIYWLNGSADQYGKDQRTNQKLAEDYGEYMETIQADIDERMREQTEYINEIQRQNREAIERIRDIDL